ncbi:MAG: DUF1573 domain-containing protein [Planctomycetota bacterium]
MICTRIVTVASLAVGMVGASFSPPASAQEWADKMFDKREHDFGTVARGAETVHRFEVTNLYKQPMKITGVTSSCGCTTPSVENGTFGTYEKAYIVAKFNTHSHVGRKGATLTVRFAPPYAAEVQLRVHGNIRGDVVFQPGAVQFGTVDQGVIKEQLISVNYAGRSNWQIVDVTNDNDHFEVELEEKSRFGGRVNYGLLVRLKDNLPAGYVKDQITVVTNDGLTDTQRIPLIVEGRVVPEISVTPEALVLGEVAAGKSVTKKLIVRGKKPFKILDVDCGDDCFTFKTDNESKPLHFVELTFNPGPQSGSVKVPVRITTDRGPNRGATLMVTAKVLAPEPQTESQAESSDQSESTTVVENARVAGTASK